MANFLIGFGFWRDIGRTEFMMLSSPVIAVGLVGVGLLSRQGWARIIGLLFAGLFLLAGSPSLMYCSSFNIPCLRGILVGVIMGGYSLWVLWNGETKILFKSSWVTE